MACETEFPGDEARNEPVPTRQMQDLYRANGPALYRFLLRWTRGDRRSAEALTRETEHRRVVIEIYHHGRSAGSRPTRPSGTT